MIVAALIFAVGVVFLTLSVMELVKIQNRHFTVKVPKIDILLVSVHTIIGSLFILMAIRMIVDTSYAPLGISIL